MINPFKPVTLSWQTFLDGLLHLRDCLHVLVIQNMTYTLFCNNICIKSVHNARQGKKVGFWTKIVHCYLCRHLGLATNHKNPQQKKIYITILQNKYQIGTRKEYLEAMHAQSFKSVPNFWGYLGCAPLFISPLAAIMRYCSTAQTMSKPNNFHYHFY